MNPSPRDNFYRCMTLIVDNGNEAAWDLLDYYLSNQGTTLKDFIENNQHEIYHLCYNYGGCCRCQYGTVNKPKSRILYQSQLDILLDTKGSNIPCTVHIRAKPTCSHTVNDHFANPNIVTKQLDLTLCRCLLFNFTNILPQGSVERNAFEDLINMRNKCCHAAKGEISSKDYQTYKAQIEKCLMALAQVYGKTHDMQLKIKDAEKRPLDESICKQLQQTILQEQVLQRTTIEIQKMGKSTKRTLQAVNSSTKSAGHTASKIKKIEESTNRTLMLVKSSKRSLKVNTERTMHAIDSSREAEESMATKIQKLDERLSICEISKRSRLLGLTQTEIEGHLMEGTFVETAAVQACIKLLETDSLIVLTGAAGTGKSRNSLEILHQFRVKHPEFDTVKLTDLHDFADVVTAEEKLVILFEDIFGRTNTRFTENTDVQIIDRLHASTIKGNVKVILTVRNTIRTSCQWVFISHKIFHGTCEVDLSSQKFKMTATEKKSLLSKYFVVNNFRLLEVEDQENYFEETILDPQIAVTINRETLNTIVETEPFLGFPEACSLFTGNRKLTRLGLSFFKHPSKYLFEEIEKLRRNGADNHQDRMSYITLVYIFLNDDILDPEDIDSERCLEISESCYGISYKKFPICQIRDAANWMIGKYLTLRCNKDTYHFQHQTILESILISYSRIDQNLILSRLSFDFIRELVRLQNYLLKEGEIVMKISPKYYQKLADRIIKIVQSEYFNNSLSITIQLLCDSEIIRENDERFVKCLIDKAHDVYFQPDYALQSYTTNNGEFRLCKLYLPALFLGRIVQQREMNKTITLLLDHLKFILTSDSGDDIKFVCYSSLSEAFLHVCELESNEKILDNVWESVMNLNMFKMTEKMHSIISTVCSRCPVTTMKWILNNIDRSTFEMNHLINMACEFKRLDVVQLICATVNHDQLDFTSAFLVALNNVRNDPDELVSKWLIKNISHQLFDMNKITSQVLVVGCVDDLNFLLQNVDNNILDMELVFTQVCKKKRHIVESFLKWMVTNVEKKLLNTHEMLILACIAQEIAVVKYLINNVDHNLLDLTSVLMSAMSSDWRGSNIDLIEWLFLHVDLKHIDMLDIINKAFQEERYEEIKTMIICSKDNLVNVNKILKSACENVQMEVIKVVLSVVDHLKLNIRDAVRSVCVLWKINLLEYFLHNVDHSLYDAKYVMEISCRYKWIHIVKWLLDNVEYSSLDISSAMNIVLHSQFGESDKALVRLFLQYPLQDKVQIVEIIQDCSLLDMLDVVKWMLKKIDQRHLDIKVVMNTACSRSHFDVVQWLLSNVDNDLFDIPTAFNNAIHAYRPDLTVSLIELLINRIDNELIDMASLLKIKDTDCLYDIVECVLESVDHNKFDFQEAFNIVYDKIYGDDDNDINNKKEKYQPLIQLILEKVKHESLELKEVLNQACRDCSLDVVNLLLENIDHKKLDVKKAMNIVYNLWVNNKVDNDKGPKGHEKEKQYENNEREEQEMEEQEGEKEGNKGGDKEDEIKEGGNINKKRNKYTHLVKLILKQVNHDSLDLKKVFNQACQYGCLDVVTLVLENNNHIKLDIMEAVNIAYSSIRDKFDDFIDRGEKYELLIKIILKKVNHDSLDLKEIMNKACRYGCLDIVTFVLQNIDLKKSDIMEAVSIVCDSPYLNNVNRDSIVLKIMYKASCSGYLEVVTFVLENTDHKKIDIMEAVNIIYSSIIDDSDYMMDQIEKYEPLIRQILEKVNHDLLDLKTVFKHAFCKRCLEVVRNLLENTDHGKLDVKGAMNIVMTTSFDPRRSLISKMGKMKEPVIKLIFEKVNHDSLALKDIMTNACCNGLLDVVTCLLENTDHKKLDIMEAVNGVYRSVCDDHDYYDVIKYLRDTYDPLIRHILEKVNHDLLDLKTIFVLACRIGCLEVVAYLLENINHDQLDAKEAVNGVYCSVCNDDEYYDIIDNLRKTYDPLIRHILEKVNHDLLDLKTIFHLACRIGCLEVVAYLLENINHDQLDVKEAVNDLFRSSVCNFDDDYDGVMNNLREKYQPLIRHILEKVNHDLFDLKTIFHLACRIGCLAIVAYLLENINHDQLDAKKAVNDLYRSVCNDDYYYDVIRNLRKTLRPFDQTYS
ncbi:Hypothetical predicted protein [Mytilus galloprovincialis]|uniref:Novel STAND NTPase 3 domain-containing protein n=1 Tax=Mytilus galloprovincialis TaxID=29158 RepID=A0A8B6G2N4_MYTGA|nr:Hypothetical predicted protein [Mytilus galloprovincialis]